MVVLKKGSPRSFDHKSSTSTYIPLCTPLAKRSAMNAFNSARLNSHAASPLWRASATEQSQMCCSITRSISHMNALTGSSMLRRAYAGRFGTGLSQSAVPAVWVSKQCRPWQSHI
ncbi:uncharacterized [Lates japonicus]